MSADTPSVLLAYGARVQLVSERGERWIPMDAFYTNDGSSNNVRTHDEILAAVALPPAGTRSFSAYHKLAARKAIDFPLVSLALVVRKNEDESIASLRLAVGAIASRPRLVRDIGEIALGRTIDAGLVAEIAAATRRQCHPLLNVTADTAWRRDVLSTCVRRAFDELVASMDTGA